jgi:precorrin-6B methylase 2
MVHAIPLTDQEYSKVFETYLSTSNEYDAMKGLCLEVLQSKYSCRHGSRILSIGAGTGAFELELMQLLDWRPSLYVAVEPNPQHAEALEQNCRQADMDAFHIVEDYFTSSSPSSKTMLNGGPPFDVILLSHSFYYLPNPDQIMERFQKELLAKDGVVLALIQTEGIVTTLCHEFLPRLEFPAPPPQNYLLTDCILAEKLQKQRGGLKLEMHRAKSYLNITNISSSCLAMVLSFILQTDIQHFPEDLRHEIYCFIDSIAELEGNERILRHDTALMIWNH